MGTVTVTNQRKRRGRKKLKNPFLREKNLTPDFHGPPFPVENQMVRPQKTWYNKRSTRHNDKDILMP